MIDDKRWAKFMRQEDVPTLEELHEALDERFTCPRCGRNDLPLALFPHHNKNCAFECAIGGPAVEVVESLNTKVDDLKDRIGQLESALRDTLYTVSWFGRWLNGRKRPVAYDNSKCECGHEGRDHTGLGRCTGPDDSECDCDVYRPTDFSVSYDARGVSRVVASAMKVLGETDFRCWQCRGTFASEHLSDKGRCRWCVPPQQTEVG